MTFAYLLDVEGIIFRETVLCIVLMTLIFSFFGWLIYKLNSGEGE